MLYDEFTHCFSCTAPLPDDPDGDSELDADGEPNGGTAAFVCGGSNPGYIIVCPSCARMARGPMGVALLDFCAKDPRGFYPLSALEGLDQ